VWILTQTKQRPLVLNNIIDVGGNSVTRGKSEDGKCYTQTTFYDDKALAQSRKLADTGLLDKAQLGLHDDADIRMMISVPSTEQWLLFQRSNPEVYKLLTSKLDAERMKGARKLSILEPAWVVQSRL